TGSRSSSRAPSTRAGSPRCRSSPSASCSRTPICSGPACAAGTPESRHGVDTHPCVSWPYDDLRAHERRPRQGARGAGDGGDRPAHETRAHRLRVAQAREPVRARGHSRSGGNGLGRRLRGPARPPARNVIVVDSSAWVEFLRKTGSPAHRRLHALLEQRREEIAVTEIVIAELLAGASAAAAQQLRHRLVTFPVLRLRGQLDFELAAGLYRICRERGEAVRHLTDCLVAVPAIRAGATLLQSDRDFEKLARHTPLQ